MCTYQTETIPVSASAKGPTGWFHADQATVYVDHPVHFGAGHALLLDVRNATTDPSVRVALELDATSARALADAIVRALDAAPAALLEA